MRIAFAGIALCLTACAPAARPDGVDTSITSTSAAMENRQIRIEYDLAKGVYAAIDRRDGTVAVRGAFLKVNDLGSNQSGWTHAAQVRDAALPLGKGKTLAITSRAEGKPSLLLELTLLEDRDYLILAGGLENTTDKDVVIREFHPLASAQAFPADIQRTGIRTLNGPGGMGQTKVTPDLNRNSVNNLLLTYLTGDGPEAVRRSIVLGGLTYREFIKHASIGGTAGGGPVLDLRAADPIGKRVSAGKSFLGEEKFYLDFVTADPFLSLEQYGLAIREAQQARPNILDFPTTDAWYVGLYEFWEADNYPEKSRYLTATSTGLVKEMEIGKERGFLKYSRAAARLIPDKYSHMHPQGPTEVGWWDDEHWARYKHYTAPYETTRKYCDGIRQAGALPFTYMDCVYEDEEFRRTHLDLLLDKNCIRCLDYSNPATQAYMRKVYARLHEGGIVGIMYDYPDYYWRDQCIHGGFDDPFATAAYTYRMMFALAKEGLGPDSWIDERVLGDPNSDLTAGVVDSQRIWQDSNTICPENVSRTGLRWYKNRVVFSYDMDGKKMIGGWDSPGYASSEADGRRMMLTMSYVASGRFILATSWRDLSDQGLYDLERVYPFHSTPQSARPVDMLVCKGWPKVYDFAVTPKWHQVTLFNNDVPSAQAELGAAMGGKQADGGLGLDAGKDYYVYDFWNEAFMGRIQGSGRLTQTLRKGEARMLSVHQVEPNPQFLSTSRHVMQGYLDMPGRPGWNAAKRTLSGTSDVVGGETYKVILACNGFRPAAASAKGAAAKIEKLPGNDDLAVLSLDMPENAAVAWSVTFEK